MIEMAAIVPARRTGSEKRGEGVFMLVQSTACPINPSTINRARMARMRFSREVTDSGICLEPEWFQVTEDFLHEGFIFELIPIQVDGKAGKQLIAFVCKTVVPSVAQKL